MESLVEAAYTASDREYFTPELHLLKSGIQNCRPRHSYGPGSRDSHVLHFVLEGRGQLTLGGQSQTLHRGDIFYLAPGQVSYYEADANAPWRYAWVNFSGGNADTYLRYAGFAPDEPVQRSRVPNEAYLAVVEEMVQERENSPAGELARASMLYRMLGMLAQAQRAPGGAGKDSHDYSRETYVAVARDYIAYHHAHIQVSDIARYVGVNRSYLTTVFKQVTGESPQDYLVRFRLERAAALLGDTDWNLREIARKVGYEDPFAFSKMFKAKWGTSPSEYRRAAQAEREG